MTTRWSDDEKACIKKLAEHFEKGEVNYSMDGVFGGNDPSDPLNLPPERRYAILQTMEEVGVIANVGHAVGLPFLHFTITSKAVQFARELAEKEKGEPMDLVEQVSLTWRRHPVLSWFIIVFVALAAIVTVLDHTLSVFKTLGWLSGSP